MSKLGDALPSWMRNLPKPLGPDELTAIDARLAAPGGKRERLTVYVCGKGHVLAEVVANLPDHGRVLVTRGVSDRWQDIPSDEERDRLRRELRLDRGRRDRALPLSTVEAIVENMRHPMFVPTCRCGAHALYLADVVAEKRRRVVLGFL